MSLGLRNTIYGSKTRMWHVLPRAEPQYGGHSSVCRSVVVTEGKSEFTYKVDLTMKFKGHKAWCVM